MAKNDTLDEAIGSNATESSELPFIVTAKTGLAGQTDVITRRLPAEMIRNNIGQVINYLTQNGVKAEQPYTESIKKELGAQGSAVLANGNSAQVDDRAMEFIAVREYKGNGVVVPYHALDLEISSVHQGGIGTSHR